MRKVQCLSKHFCSRRRKARRELTGCWPGNRQQRRLSPATLSTLNVEHSLPGQPVNSPQGLSSKECELIPRGRKAGKGCWRGPSPLAAWASPTRCGQAGGSPGFTMASAWPHLSQRAQPTSRCTLSTCLHAAPLHSECCMHATACHCPAMWQVLPCAAAHVLLTLPLMMITERQDPKRRSDSYFNPQTFPQTWGVANSRNIYFPWRCRTAALRNPALLELDSCAAVQMTRLKSRPEPRIRICSSVVQLYCASGLSHRAGRAYVIAPPQAAHTRTQVRLCPRTLGEVARGCDIWTRPTLHMRLTKIPSRRDPD